MRLYGVPIIDNTRRHPSFANLGKPFIPDRLLASLNVVSRSAFLESSILTCLVIVVRYFIIFLRHQYSLDRTIAFLTLDTYPTTLSVSFWTPPSDEDELIPAP